MTVSCISELSYGDLQAIFLETETYVTIFVSHKVIVYAVTDARSLFIC